MATYILSDMDHNFLSDNMFQKDDWAFMAQTNMEDTTDFLSLEENIAPENFLSSGHSLDTVSSERCDEPWKEMSDGSDSGIDTFSMKHEPVSPTSLFSDCSSDIALSMEMTEPADTATVTELTSDEWESLQSILFDDETVKSELSSPASVSSVDPLDSELDVFCSVSVQSATSHDISVPTVIGAGGRVGVSSSPVGPNGMMNVSTVLNSKIRIQPKPITIYTTNGNTITTVPATSVTPAVRPAAQLPKVLPVPSMSIATANHVDLRAVKRQQRMIKNRESACLSRKRKKDYMQSLEQQLQSYNADNERLRAENVTLKRKLALLLSENQQLKKSSSSTSPAVAKTAGISVVFCILMFISLNALPFRLNDAKRENIVPSSHIGRTLLSVDEASPLVTYMAANESSRSVSSSHRSRLSTPDVGSDVSIWQDVHDLVFGRHTDDGVDRLVCPNFFNSTESMRLVNELRGWVLGHEEELRRQREVIRMAQDRARPRKKYYPPRKLKAAMRNDMQSSAGLRSDSKYELQLFRGTDSRFNHFLEAINRRNDTFYVVSFRHDHLLLPATAHNKTTRPRMSVMMPAVGLNETMQPPVGSIAMMQIDCEVTATRLIHIDKSAVPADMPNVTSSSSAWQQRHHGNRRQWVMSDTTD